MEQAPTNVIVFGITTDGKPAAMSVSGAGQCAVAEQAVVRAALHRFYQMRPPQSSAGGMNTSMYGVRPQDIADAFVALDH
jgi:hypothetical protein